MKKVILSLLLTVSFIFLQAATNLLNANNFDPPENFTVDALTSIGTWDAPSNSNSKPTGYQLILNNSVVDTVSADVFSYQFSCLQYNQNYTASVKAMYDNDLSDADSYSWSSLYLRPVATPFAATTYGSPTVNFNFEPVEPCDSSTPFDMGLLSINLYRDGILIGNFPYDPEGTTSIIDTPPPGSYDYCTEAIWDLSAYGLSGQSGTSMQSCQTVYVAFGFTLPFTENWTSGMFDTQQWDNAGTWQITNAQGNNAPASIFSPAGNQYQNYEVPLTSYYFNLDTASVGNVYFSYDVKLENNNPTGNEQLKIQIYYQNQWQTLKTYSNNNSFEWLSDTLNITNFALGEFFKIRFNATGVNSNNIAAWLVDNVSVFIDYASPLGVSPHNIDKTKRVIVFPNPAGDNFTVKSTAELQNVVVYDFLGKQIYQVNAGNSKQIVINTGLFSSGIYFVKAESFHSVNLIKLVVK